MLQSYLKIAFRNLLRNRVVSVINIAGLSLGLTCCLLLFLYTKDELSFDRFHEKKDRIYRVTATITNDKETTKRETTNSPVGPAFQEDIPEIESFVRVQDDFSVIKKDGENYNQNIVHVDSNFFSVFSFPLLAGNPETALTEPGGIVLTEETAVKYFGTADAMGKILQMKRGEVFENKVVTGVAANPPLNSSIQFQALMPFDNFSDEWIGFYLNTFVVLSPKADLAAVQPKLDQVFHKRAAAELSRMKKEYGSKEVYHFDLQSFTDIHLKSESELYGGLTSASKPIYSYILSAIAIFILLIACINFINLTVAHSLRRGKEIGLRKAIGGERKQLIFQFLGESSLVCLISFVLALLFAQLLLPLFNDLADKRLSLSYLMDAQLIGGYVLIFLVTTCLAGFYPALVLSGFSPVQTLYDRFRFTGRNFLTKGLVVFQFALAGFFMVATVIIYRQFDFLTHKDLGYDDKNMVVMHLARGGIKQSTIDLFKNELSKVPSVVSVAAKNSGNRNATVGQVDGKEIEFGYFKTDADYLKTLQIGLVAGRSFSPDFPADSTESVMVNEALVKAAGWKNPVGKQIDFTWKNKKQTVVGVVKDYHYGSLKDKIKPLVFTADPHYGYGELWIKIKPENLPETMSKLAAIQKKIMPLSPYDYSFADADNVNNYEQELRWRQIITWAAIITVFISCIGLFGLTAMTIQKRTKEIGIRKVLGASVLSISTLLSVDFVKLVLIALIIASPLAWLAGNYWLEDYAYRIEVTWWFFAVSAGGAILISILTVSFQAIKAAMMNPVKSLRTD
ncbi:FtsX-like permease family protein [Emticicia sp. CRIBPO]|uniref:ABC transporter permease n=1 Tax=Emticicia sp. CRIBPO TaxID=2683258 RepID=UPI0014123CB3|nr:ABC transporter permease [Emticicia sp. CRIBPO]NBA85816.1 FtsX-like permease family protein [Emticicia sp. CRIBPO]